MDETEEARVKLGPAGLVLGDETLPLHAGSVDYFRLPRSAWRPALEAVRSLGAHLVDVAVPWGVHEKARGVFDFGRDNLRLDVVHFLELAGECGLRAIVRPGPGQAAELAFGGIPERVVWDEACQARSPTGRPVILAALPLAYPAPSLASRAFHEEASLWLRAVAEQLGPLGWPHGPIVLLALADAERSHTQDDYHPDAVAQYRRFLTRKYGNVSALRRAHPASSASFATVEPPASLGEATADDLGPHLDWCEFQEALLESALYRRRGVLGRHGLGGIPVSSALPPPHAAADLARLAHVVDTVSLEVHARASDEARTAIADMTMRVVARCTSRGVPAFARASTGFAAGRAARTEQDDAFTAQVALAYGARGLGLHMAVQRDRWIGGPIDDRGVRRPSAALWTGLFGALDRLRFHELVRRAPVRIVVPRSLTRLARVCQAWGPLRPEAFASAEGQGSLDTLEGDLDPSRGAVAEAHVFLTTLERVLERARVPYLTTDADGLERVTPHAAWTIVVCPGALDPELTAWIGQAILSSARISVGPRAPERDERFAPSSVRLPPLERPVVPIVLPRGPATLAELVRTTLADLGIEPLHAEPEGIHTTLHQDAEGRPRVLFVINGTAESVLARVSAAGASGATDALTHEVFSAAGGLVALPVPARTVRILALSHTL
jgi:beta-galactosidase